MSAISLHFSTSNSFCLFPFSSSMYISTSSFPYPFVHLCSFSSEVFFSVSFYGFILLYFTLLSLYFLIVMPWSSYPFILSFVYNDVSLHHFAFFPPSCHLFHYPFGRLFSVPPPTSNFDASFCYTSFFLSNLCDSKNYRKIVYF